MAALGVETGIRGRPRSGNRRDPWATLIEPPRLSTPVPARGSSRRASARIPLITTIGIPRAGLEPDPSSTPAPTRRRRGAKSTAQSHALQAGVADPGRRSSDA